MLVIISDCQIFDIAVLVVVVEVVVDVAEDEVEVASRRIIMGQVQVYVNQDGTWTHCQDLKRTFTENIQQSRLDQMYTFLL